jgi:YesN/AraC family two-component response regulator
MHGDKQKTSLLLLEDDPSLRQILIKVFKESAYEVRAVQDGESGIRALKSFSPDIIVSDVLMPKMNGIDFLKYIRTNSDYQDTPFIILSAKATVQDRIEGLEHGADDYLTKPFDIQELLLRIRNTLQLRQRSIQQPLSLTSDKTLEQRSVVFLRRLQQYLVNNITDTELNLNKVSEALKMSPSGLQKKIKRLTDKSFTQYVRELRLDHAKDLLDTGTLNVNEVAEKSGFKNVSYFSDAFRKYFSFPPSHLIK